MEQTTKDIIGAASQIAVVLSVVVAIIVAVVQIRKNRRERARDREEELATREKEIRELNRNTQINNFRFWLELRRMFWQHHDIHVKFRNGEQILVDELPQVEAYMGLFELCYEMLQEELIDWPIFCRLYEYRIDNIMNNSDVVKAKLIDAEDGWKSFIALITRLGYIKEGNTYLKKVG